MNKYLEGDMKNITYSLHRIATFVRERKLEDKIAEDIPQTMEFCYTAWDFLLSIYESYRDKLEANKDKKSFWQYISLQFNRKPSTNLSQKNQTAKPKSYAQALKGDINEIIKIKDVFSKLSSNKISEIHKVINNSDKMLWQPLVTKTNNHTR